MSIVLFNFRIISGWIFEGGMGEVPLRSSLPRSHRVSHYPALVFGMSSSAVDGRLSTRSVGFQAKIHQCIYGPGSEPHECGCMRRVYWSDFYAALYYPLAQYEPWYSRGSRSGCRRTNISSRNNFSKKKSN